MMWKSKLVANKCLEVELGLQDLVITSGSHACRNASLSRPHESVLLFLTL